MAKRKWLFFGSVLLLLLLLGAAGAAVYLWIQSGVIRQKLVVHLQEQLQDVDVEVGTVWWLPWSSIHVNDLRLIRRDNPTRTPYLSVPQAKIYPDKELFAQGKLAIRKIELDRPEFNIERNLEGKWNFENLARLDGAKDAAPLPLLQIRAAKVNVFDLAKGSEPVLRLHDISATLINDPLPLFTLKAEGSGDFIGAFALQGELNRSTGCAGAVDLPGLTISPELIKAVNRYCPQFEECLRDLRGKAVLHLDLTAPTGAPLTYNVRLQFREGRWSHPSLPVSIENLRFDAQYRNGDLTIPNLTAKAGGASIGIALDLARESICAPTGVPLTVPRSAPARIAPNPNEEVSPLQAFEDRLRKLEISVQQLRLDPELFARMPARAKLLQDMFAPSGPVDVSYSYVREEGIWHKKFKVRPNGIEATYRGFPYPLKGVRGVVEYAVDSFTSSLPDQVSLDLTAEGCGSTVTIKGTVKGSTPDLDVDLQIAGNGITLDPQLVAALPDDNPKLIERLHGAAFGDFVAHIRHNERIRREHGPDVFDNLFTIRIRNGSIKYEQFPYLLENLAGTLVIRTVPNHPTRLPPLPGVLPPRSVGDVGVLEFRHFKGTHQGAVVRGHGRKDPIQGGSLLDLNLQAENIALDGDLHKALSALRLDSAWASFNPQGRINCNTHVRLIDRTAPDAVFNPADDLQLSMAFSGAAIRPTFFNYAFSDVSGAFRYSRGKVEMERFAARHDKVLVTLPKAEILFRPSGGFWAELREVDVVPFLFDSDFLRALPPVFRSACEGVELKGSLKLHATRIVIDEQPGPYMPRYLPGPRVIGARGQAPADMLFASYRGGDAGAVQASQFRPIGKEVRPVLPTIYWDGSIALDGASFRTGVAWEDVHGKFACWGRYEGDRLGAIRGNIDFARVALARQPIENVRAKLWVDPKQPDVLQIDALTGKLFGGDVGGQGWVVMETPIRYALNLQGAGIRLSEIARHYQLGPKTQLEGLATAQIYLQTKLDDRTGMEVLHGAGAIDVPCGKLLNLPLLLNLLKVAKLHVPDQTGFEEAHVMFGLRGSRIKFGQLDLIGNAISLGGEGEMNADGTHVQLEFYPVWTKMKELFVLPGDLTAELSKRMFKIRVSGQLDGKLEYKSEPVPILVEPLKRVMQKMKQ